MILSFRHKGLKKFFDTGSTAGIQAKHKVRLRMQLAALDTATCLDDIDVPGYKLHPLKGKRSTEYAITVNGNWRLVFEFRDGNVHILNYEDYH